MSIIISRASANENLATTGVLMLVAGIVVLLWPAGPRADLSAIGTLGTAMIGAGFIVAAWGAVLVYNDRSKKRARDEDERERAATRLAYRRAAAENEAKHCPGCGKTIYSPNATACMYCGSPL